MSNSDDRASDKPYSAAELAQLLKGGVNDFGIILTCDRGRVIDWNIGATRLFGYGADEVTGRHLSLLYGGKEFELSRMLERTCSQGRFDGDTILVRKDGTKVPVHLVVNRVDEAGLCVGHALVIQGLTRRSEGGDGVQPRTRGEQIYHSLVSGVKDYAIFMLDANGCILTWNEGAARLKGYTEDEVLGKHFSLFYLEEARQSGHPRLILDLARKNGSYGEEGWRVKKDGSTFWASVLITPIFEEGDNQSFLGFAKVTKDLTDAKLSRERELAVLQKEVVFRTLVDSIRDYAIFMLDANGIILTWNQGAAHICGYTAEEVLGKHFSLLYTPEDARGGHPQNELEQAVIQGRYEEEGQRVRKDGSTFWANVILTPVYEKGLLSGFAKITRDLTDRRILELEKEAAHNELRAALDAKSRFLSIVSHEVRTPMAGVIGLAELLSFHKFDEESDVIVIELLESAKRLLNLLNNLLDTAKIESNNLTLESRWFDVRALLTDVRQLILPQAVKKSLELSSFCDGRLPELIFGDELRLRQILLNLASNAAKFTDDGGVLLSCELIECNHERLRLRFCVEDTGIGIKDAEINQLFKPFSQTSSSTSRTHGGTGLGLSICKSLVDLMGGQIGVNSRPGAGSTFWFEIESIHSNGELA